MSITTDIPGPLGVNTMRVIFLYVGQGELTDAEMGTVPEGADI